MLYGFNIVKFIHRGNNTTTETGEIQANSTKFVHKNIKPKALGIPVLTPIF